MLAGYRQLRLVLVWGHGMYELDLETYDMG